MVLHSKATMRICLSILDSNGFKHLSDLRFRRRSEDCFLINVIYQPFNLGNWLKVSAPCTPSGTYWPSTWRPIFWVVSSWLPADFKDFEMLWIAWLRFKWWVNNTCLWDTQICWHKKLLKHQNIILKLFVKHFPKPLFIHNIPWDFCRFTIVFILTKLLLVWQLVLIYNFAVGDGSWLLRVTYFGHQLLD